VPAGALVNLTSEVVIAVNKRKSQTMTLAKLPVWAIFEIPNEQERGWFQKITGVKSKTVQVLQAELTGSGVYWQSFGMNLCLSDSIKVRLVAQLQKIIIQSPLDVLKRFAAHLAYTHEHSCLVFEGNTPVGAVGIDQNGRLYQFGELDSFALGMYPSEPSDVVVVQVLRKLRQEALDDWIQHQGRDYGRIQLDGELWEQILDLIGTREPINLIYQDMRKAIKSGE
jgi:hypothetical protein